LKPVRSIKPDIARIIMKEQNRDVIQYHPAKERLMSGTASSKVSFDPVAEAKMIPREDIEHYQSQDYKDIISRMRGSRKDNAFSNYSRFIPPTRFELEAIEERNKFSFSVIDTSKKLLKKVPNYPHF
jgi:hypothetical protein